MLNSEPTKSVLANVIGRQSALWSPLREWGGKWTQEIGPAVKLITYRGRGMGWASRNFGWAACWKGAAPTRLLFDEPLNLRLPGGSHGPR